MAKQGESLIRDAICQYLDTRKDVYYWVNRNTSAYLGGGKFGRPPKGFKYGVADIIAIRETSPFHNPDFFAIEVKTYTGQQSDYQKEHQKQVIAHGGKYVLARKVDDVQKEIELYE